MKYLLRLALAISVFLCAGGQTNDGGFRDVGVNLHNNYRAQRGLGPLALDSALNIVAHHHAEKLATSKSFHSSGYGYGQKENLWAYAGPLRPLAVDVTDAVNCWFLGTTNPGNIVVSMNREVLYSNSTKLLGIGVGTSDDYTVVVANYLN